MLLKKTQEISEPEAPGMVTTTHAEETGNSSLTYLLHWLQPSATWDKDIELYVLLFFHKDFLESLSSL